MHLLPYASWYPPAAIAATAAVGLWVLFSDSEKSEKKTSSSESQRNNSYKSQKEKVQRQLQQAKKINQNTSKLYQETKRESNNMRKKYSNMEENYNNLYNKYQQQQRKNSYLQSSRIKSQKKINNLTTQMDRLHSTITSVTKDLQHYKNLARKNSDPQLYSKAKQSIFTSFLDNIKTYNFTDLLPKQPNHRYHMVMGLISVGKSSLLNKITGANLKTGRGQTTNLVSHIGRYQNGKKFVNIYDAPGINQDFSCYDIQTLALLSGMDQIFVVYNTSLKQAKDLLQIIYALKPNQTITCIRTQCDLFENQDKDEASCEQELEKDKKYMSKIGIPCRIFAFSSRMDMNFRDNAKVQELIKGTSN